MYFLCWSKFFACLTLVSSPCWDGPNPALPTFLSSSPLALTADLFSVLSKAPHTITRRCQQVSAEQANLLRHYRAAGNLPQPPKFKHTETSGSKAKTGSLSQDSEVGWRSEKMTWMLTENVNTLKVTWLQGTSSTLFHKVQFLAASVAEGEQVGAQRLKSRKLCGSWCTQLCLLWGFKHQVRRLKLNQA